jgi:zinc protease
MHHHLLSSMRVLAVTALLSGGLTAPVLARPVGPASVATASKAKKVTSVEGITEYLLPNGLRILLFPDPSSAVITTNITYLVGSRHEGYGETGMAHLLEHLMFKGSTRHPKIPEELTNHGARPNGTTWLDRTNYFETFQATPANLEWSLSLESDRMTHSFIAKKDLDSEMTVVRNEFESGENDPMSILSERVISSAFLWHNYGNPTIGARADIEKVPIDRLRAFYRRYYQPDNAILVVAGKIDEAKTLSLVEKYFGPIPRPGRKLIPTYTEEPVQDGERSVTLRRVGDVQAAIAAYHCPPGSHPDFAALEIMGEVLGDTPSGRLYKALVATGKAVDVSGGSYQLREPGMSLFSCSLRKEGNLDEASDILVKTIEDFPNSPPSAVEVERARTNLLKSVEQTLNKSERLALQLSEWAAMGDWRHFFLYRDRLEKVTPEDVQRVAKAYLLPSNRTLGKFIPTEKPERAQVPWVADPAVAVKSYKGKPPVVAGEVFVPTPGNCNQRDRRVVLPGGLKLSTFQKKTRGNTVNFTMALRFSNLPTSLSMGLAPATVASMMLRGSQKHTREQIADEFDRLRSRVSISSDASTLSVALETTRPNLIPTLKLVAEILRQPAWDAKEFELDKQETIAGAEQMQNDPETLAENVLSRHLAPYPAQDPRYTDTPEELMAQAKSLTLEQVKAYYAKVYGANCGEVAVVGDFDPQEVEKVLHETLGDWKSPVAYERIPGEFFDVPAINRQVVVKDKANATLVGGLNMVMRDDHPDYLPLVLGNFMLGGGFLNSRLATRVRQKEGLSYGVGSTFSAGSLDNVGNFGVYAIAAPENVAKVESAIREEMARALKDGFTEAELASAKSGFLQRREGSRSNDGSLAGTLVRYQRIDRRFTWDADFEKKVAAVTNQQIVEAMRRHFVIDKLSLVKAGDFKLTDK